MRSLPSAAELKAAFTSFADFTFVLLESIESKPGHLRFAALNSQVALELFLKYHYVASGKCDQIRKKKNGALENDFVDFSQILSHFYSSRRVSYGEKKELSKLLHSRNEIVHRGGCSSWDKDLAESVVRTLFFIHATAWSEHQEFLLFNSHLPHKISRNKVWRAGAQSFVYDLIDDFNAEVITCLACGAATVVRGDIMALEEHQCEDDLVCLTCLSSIDLSHEAHLIDCYNCHDKAYLVEALNEQDNQLYVGKCSECDTDTWVRKCLSCEDLYHPLASDEVEEGGKYFCSQDCLECYREGHESEF